MRRLGLTLFAVVTAACSGAQPATDARTAPPPRALRPADDAGAPAGGPLARTDDKDSKLVAKTLARVSTIRGLESTRAVPGVKLRREDLAARVKEKALREYPPEALRREGQVLQLLGFAPAGFDYLGETIRLLEAQLEGFYEPNNGTMYLASELRGQEAQATLAHELVHALQDMHWDLKSRSVYRPGRGDESLALACLAEGDATSAMMDYVMKPQTALDLPQDVLRESMKAGLSMGDLASVPHVLKTSLVAPYIEGLSFVHALRKKSGWEGVNRAWKRPPTTTEQVLHLEKWEANEGAIEVPPPTGKALGEGWKREDEDTFGELGFALAYEEWMPHEEAHRIASGWGGDRSAAFQSGDQIAFAVHERYDATPKESLAERALQKLLPALEKNLGRAAIKDDVTLCFERKDTGPLLFARRDRDLVMIAGPARIAKDGWSSTSSCAAAKTWATEILSQK